MTRVTSTFRAFLYCMYVRLSDIHTLSVTMDEEPFINLNYCKIQRIEAVERATKIARLLLGFFLLCDFGLTIALIVQPLNDIHPLLFPIIILTMFTRPNHL